MRLTDQPPFGGGAWNFPMKVSIVAPVYNEESVILEFFQRIEAILPIFMDKFNINRDNIEILLINDGSVDGSFDLLKCISDNNTGYKLIDLSRNYGHQIAITAGIENSQGDAIVIIDVDLQDPPEIILPLYEKFLEGYDVVNAVRTKREGESFFKIITAKLFYRVLNKLTHVDIPLDTGDFRIINRRVADTLNQMREKQRFVRGMISWVGFKQTGIPYNRDKRYAGKTKYPLNKMIKLALDGITSFSSFPLRLSSYLGFMAAFFGFIYSVVVLYTKLFTDTAVPGWASINCVVLFLGGAQLICLGMIGEYLSRIYDEAKARPLYLIAGIYGKPQTDTVINDFGYAEKC
jgi:dolichol-phosphate mannosyltransferase